MTKRLPPLVAIEWEDSAQAAPQWQWAADCTPPPTAQCISVGFLIRDNKKEKALAISLANAFEFDSAQVSGVITIPTRCVIRMKRLIYPFCRPYDRAAASKLKQKAS